MNVGEHGIIFRLGTNGFVLTPATALSLTFRKPQSGQVLFVTSPDVAIGIVDIGALIAGQYVDYIFKAGDVSEHGVWLVRLTYEDPLIKLISEPVQFVVNP